MVRTRIAIVEDDPALRRRFSSVFAAEPDFELVAAVGTGAEALALVAGAPLDVLVVDLGLPDMDGTAVIRETAARQPACDVVVVTIFGNDEQVLASLAAGATGYLLKDDLPSEIVDCVRLLRNGGSPVSPTIARRLLSLFRREAGTPGAPSAAAGAGAGATSAAELSLATINELPGRPRARPEERARAAPRRAGEETLSLRETEILELVAKGLSVAEIGSTLGLSPYTVGTHVKNIYRKLAVHSRLEAVFEARQMGLLRP